MEMINRFPVYHSSETRTKECWSLSKTEYFIFLFMLFLFVVYGNTSVLDCIVIFLFLFTIAFFAFKKKLELLYFPLIFFDSILVLPFGGSFFRIYELVFIIYTFLNGNLKIDRKIIPFALFALFSFYYSESISWVVSIVLNTLIMYLIFTKLWDSEENRNVVFQIIALATVFSALYALLNTSGISGSYGVRYSGTVSDPNYSALFYLIGIISLLCTNKFKLFVKGVLFLFLFYSLLRTISLSGILISVLLIFLFSFFATKKKIFIVFSFASAVVIFFLISFSTDSPFYGIHIRLINLFESLKTGDYNKITTGRENLSSYYLEFFFNSGNGFNIVFGGRNTVSGAFRDSMVFRFGNVSHNSFIDILFMNGIIGLVLIILYLVRQTGLYFKKFFKTQDKTYLGFVLLKLCVVFFGMTISIYPFKYFNIFLLI